MLKLKTHSKAQQDIPNSDGKDVTIWPSGSPCFTKAKFLV